MAIATNTNYMAPVVAPDLGTPTKIPPTGLANGLVPETPITAQEMNYLLNRLCPRVETFEANGTFTQRAGDKIINITLIGGGAGGLGGASGDGGDGGQAGEIVDTTFHADSLSATLGIVIGAAGNGTSSNTNTAFAKGGDSKITMAGLDLIIALGGFSDTYNELAPTGALGGNGGAGVGGAPGAHSRRGPPGAGGAANAVGAGGRGYGAGGGGGRQNGGTNSGGGGGGGGLGTNALAGAGSTNTGGPGAPGRCIITVWGDIT